MHAHINVSFALMRVDSSSTNECLSQKITTWLMKRTIAQRNNDYLEPRML